MSQETTRVRVRRKKIKKEKLETFIASKKFSNSVALAVQNILLEHSEGDADDSDSAVTRSRRASLSLERSSITVPPITSTLQRSNSSESLHRSAEIIVPTSTPPPTDLRRVAVRNSSPRDVGASGNSSANVSPRTSSVMTRIKDVFHTSPRRAALSPSGSKVFAKDSNQVGICAHFSGNYDFLRLLGQGGMSSVYEADYRGLNVAIKVYIPHFCIDGPDEERDKLIAKIVYVGNLPENRRIVPLFAYRFEPSPRGGSQLILVMGLMSTSLSSIVKQRRKSYYGSKKQKSMPFPERLERAPFSQTEIAHILMQILEGVEFLHKNGVIHRDLKGENILGRRRDFESAQEVFDKGGLSPSQSTLSQSASRNNNDDDDEIATDEQSDSSSGDAARLLPPKKYLQTTIDICTGEPLMIMEENVGRCYEFKIADFDECRIEGQSNFLRRSSSLSQSTQKQTAPQKRFSLHVGTLNYRAPEMVDKTTVYYTNKVDIWAVGMILYLLLTLEIPYMERGDQFKVHYALEKKEVPILPSGYIFTDSWNVILQIYKSCVQIDPDKRLSASDLLQIVTKIL